jgi:hypothetical protein
MMGSVMSSSTPASTLRFPVRRDGWDTVDFYLPLFFGLQATGIYQIVMGLGTIAANPWRWMSWLMLLMGVSNFAFGMVVSVLRTWRRFAERYELTESEFVMHYGYCRHRVAYREISKIHPIKICRSTATLKPAVRIHFRKPMALQGGGNMPEEPSNSTFSATSAASRSSRRGRSTSRPSTWKVFSKNWLPAVRTSSGKGHGSISYKTDRFEQHAHFRAKATSREAS